MSSQLFFLLVLVFPFVFSHSEPEGYSEMKALLPNTLSICKNQTKWIENTISENSFDPQLLHSAPSIDFVKHICDALEPLASVQIPIYMDLTDPGYFFGAYRRQLYEDAVRKKTDFLLYEHAEFFFTLLKSCRNRQNKGKDQNADEACRLAESFHSAKIPLDYSNILAGDLNSRIEPPKEHVATNLIRMLESTSKDYRMTFATGPLLLSLDGGVVHYTKPDLFLDDNKVVQHKTRTHYNEHSLYYAHPQINHKSIVSKETKLIHTLRDGFFQSLWNDKAISSCPRTPNGNSYKQDHVNDIILGLQDFKEPKDILESWFPPSNFALNQRLMARIKSGIAYSISDVHGSLGPGPMSLISDEDNIHKLVHWYKHIILRYSQNVKDLLKLITNNSGKYSRAATVAREILSASEKSDSDYLYDFETLKLFVKTGLTCELTSNIADYVDYPGSLIANFLQDFIDTIENVKNIEVFKKLVDCSKNTLTREAYERFINIHREAQFLNAVFTDFNYFPTNRERKNSGGARILDLTVFEHGKKYYLQSEAQLSEILHAIDEYKPGNSWGEGSLKKGAAQKLLALANNKNANFFLRVDNVELLIQLGLPFETAAIVSKHADDATLEQLVVSLVSRARTFEMLGGVKRFLSRFRDRLSEEQFARQNKYIDDTETYYGLFKIVKCDEASFKGCDTLQEDLKYYYLKSEQEVKDVLEIAMRAFLEQDAEKCAPLFKYEKTSDINTLGHFMLHGDVLGCEVVVNYAQEMSPTFWSVFVHEMAHKAFHAVYKNNANPYSNQESKEQYKAMMDKILSPLPKVCNENLFVHMGRHLASTFIYGVNNIRYDLATVPCLYPSSEHDSENVVRYYQHITTDGLYAADQVFVGMKEFHNNNFLKKAVKAGFLSSDRCNATDDPS